MSFQRTRGPIMTDAIMYHNEDRIKPHHAFAKQPKESMLGFPGKHIFYESPICEDTSSRAKTKLFSEDRGYSHTGLFGVHYKPPPIDPRYTITKYGNQRPQAINYFSRSTNLLFK